jgi:hypothetical protein
MGHESCFTRTKEIVDMFNVIDRTGTTMVHSEPKNGVSFFTLMRGAKPFTSAKSGSYYLVDRHCPQYDGMVKVVICHRVWDESKRCGFDVFSGVCPKCGVRFVTEYEYTFDSVLEEQHSLLCGIKEALDALKLGVFTANELVINLSSSTCELSRYLKSYNDTKEETKNE